MVDKYIDDEEIIGELREQILNGAIEKEDRTYHTLPSLYKYQEFTKSDPEPDPPIVKPVVKECYYFIPKKKPCIWKTGTPKWWAWPIVLVARFIIKIKENHHAIQINHI
ncbi:MAG: hypothetical protein J6W64_09870 [Bacilli bacterium]|nr:hypothetical protein [Bacilli bacterium]MBO7504719.1 hypothetical protein [bacterium]